jgi:hypothetical protein
MVVASRCHAWYAGYTYQSGTLASVWAQATPALCPTCNEGQAWVYQYAGRYVQVWVNEYGDLYTSTSVQPSGAFVATTRGGSAVGVSFSAINGVAGKITARLTYTTSTGGAKNILKTFNLPGWNINGGYMTAYSYGPEASVPAGIVDQWVSTIPANAAPLLSGGRVCGSPSWFRAGSC